MTPGERASRYRKLISATFSTGSGKELLEEWKDIFVYGNLYDSDPQKMSYMVAQRDFVLELDSNIKRGKNDAIK